MNELISPAESIVCIPPVPGWPSFRGTLANPVSMAGRGLHTGRRCLVDIHPAPAGHGIVFERETPGTGVVKLPARLEHRIQQPMCTALASPLGPRIRTTEHLLAALRACNIDDALIRLNAEEIPILDGSAAPWIKAITAAGRHEHPVPMRFIQVLSPVEWSQHSHHLKLEPHDTPALRIDLTLTMKDIGKWRWQGELTPRLFREEMAAARSFGRLKHVIPAIFYGLIKGQPILRGASPSCAAAIVGKRVIGGTRMPDEFLRHKFVDLLGDLALLGHPLLGKLTALRPTHDSNYGLMATLVNKPTAWRLIEVSPASRPGEDQ